MFRFGKRNKAHTKPVIEKLDDLKKLQAQGGDEFMRIVPQYAEEGNTVCQTFLAQASMHMMSLTDDPKLAAHLEERYVKYATMAAESGDAGEQFNLGLFYFKKFDADKDYVDDEDLENFRAAAYWMRQAADADFGPALECVDTFEAMAERRYAETNEENFEEDLQEADNENEGQNFARLMSNANEQMEFDRVVSELAPSNFGDVGSVIQKIGFERAVRFYAHLVRLRIPDDRVRWQFILEELDGAAQGNSEAQAFARQSGVPEHEYTGALDRSIPEVDGPEGPQQMLRQLGMQLMQDQSLMVEFTTSIVRCIMEDHGLDT